MRCISAVMLGVVIAVAPQAAHAKSESFVKVDIQSIGGGFMFLAPVLGQRYDVWISQVAANGKPGKTIRLRVSGDKAMVDPVSGMALKIAAAPPGQYVVRMILMQEHWGACLAQRTVGFIVQPGQIAYLGALQSSQTIQSLESEVMRTGKGRALRSQLRMFRDNLSPPAFSFDAAPRETQILETARSNGLGSSFPVKATVSSPTSFPSPAGSDLVGYCD